MTEEIRHISRVIEPRSSRPDMTRTYFLTKLQAETDPSDVYYDLKHGEAEFIIVDTRGPEAFAEEHIPGAISMPHRKINRETTSTWNKDKLIVTYCYGPACNPATKAAAKLTALGFSVKEMIGGIEYWKKEGYPVQKQEQAKVVLTAPVLA